MVYNIFKTRIPSLPFVVIAENTINTTSTSVNLVGKKKEAYGEPEQQSKLNMLENFADGTSPPNPVLGQEWFNTQDDKLYVCVQESPIIFEKVSRPLISSTAPVTSLFVGDLWFNTTSNQLFVYNGISFELIGPSSSVPATVLEELYTTRQTSNATPSQLFVNGVTNARMVIPVDESWLFEVTVVARRTDVLGETRSWKAQGMINNSTTVTTQIGSTSFEFVAQAAATNTWNVTVGANDTFDSLDIEVTGQVGKVINWNAITRLTKA